MVTNKYKCTSVRGFTSQVSRQFFWNQNKMGGSSTSYITFLVRMHTSNLPPPPLTMVLHPPSPFASMIHFHAWESIKTNIVACRLPWGVPLCQPIFKFCPPGGALVACKPIKRSAENHPPRHKAPGETLSARQILRPAPFRRSPCVSVWDCVLLATATCTHGSLSTGIVVGWGTMT